MKQITQLLYERASAKLASTLGYEDQLVLPPRGVQVQAFGAGFLFSPVGEKSFDVLHIIPHGSVRATEPEEASQDSSAIAEALAANCDAGTTTLCNGILNRISRGEAPGERVAYFDLSRLILDANRRNIEDQITSQAYVGSAGFWTDKSREARRQLRDELLQPWLDAVNRILAGVRIAIHHHTFDTFGQAALPHDNNHFSRRPPIQFFQNSSSFEPEGMEETVIRVDLLRELVQVAREWLTGEGLDAAVQVDTPLTLPLLPFLDCQPAQHPNPESVIYEIRKDLLCGKPRVESWSRTIPRLVSTCRSYLREAQPEEGTC